MSKSAAHSCLVIVALAAVLLLPACQRQSQQADQAAEIELTMQTEASPTVGPAEILLSFTDPAGEPVELRDLELRGDMTHPGIVPVIVEPERVAAGRYQANLEWTMAGDWQLTIQGQLEDGRELKRTIDLRVQETSE